MDMSKGGKTMTQKDIAWEIEKMVWFIEDSKPSRHHNFVEHIKRYLPLLNNSSCTKI